jgi:hypothetical protein
VGQVDLVVGVLAVDHEDLATVDVEQLHTVGVLAEHAVGHGHGDGGRRVEGALGVREQRITPAHEDVPAVAIGDVDRVVGLGRDPVEVEAGHALSHGGRSLQERRAHDGRAGPERQNAAEETAARDRTFHDAVEILNLGTGEVQLVPLVGGQFLGIDIFHVVSPWKSEKRRSLTGARVGTAAAHRRGIGAP